MIQIDTNSPEKGQAASHGLRNSRSDQNGEDATEFAQIWSEFIEADTPKVAPPSIEQSPIVKRSDAASPDIEATEVQPRAHPVEIRMIEGEGTQTSQPSHEGIQKFPATAQSGPHAHQLSATTQAPISNPIQEEGRPEVAPTPEQTSESFAVPPHSNTLPNPSVVASPPVFGEGNTGGQLQRQLSTDPVSVQTALRDQDSKTRLPIEGARKPTQQISDLSATPTAQVPLSAVTQAPAQATTHKQSNAPSITLPPQEQSGASQSVAKPNPSVPSTAIPPLPIIEPSIPMAHGTPEIELSALQHLHSSGASTSTTVAPAPHPSAPQVASQIVAAISQSSGTTTEIILNPEELGRVRISLTNGDAGMTVNILAERAETTDLMRRHIELLARELRDMGYENPSFTFGERSDGSSDAWDDENSEPTQENPNNVTEPPTPSMQVTLSGGLDLKL